MKVYVAVKYSETYNSEIKVFLDVNGAIKQLHTWAGERFIDAFHGKDYDNEAFEAELIKDDIETSWSEFENEQLKFISWGSEGRKTDCWWDLVDIE